MEYPFYVKARGKDYEMVEKFLTERFRRKIEMPTALKQLVKFKNEIECVFVFTDGTLDFYPAYSEMAEVIMEKCHPLIVEKLEDAEMKRVTWSPKIFETRVLFRDAEENKWRAGYFSRYDKEDLFPYSIISTDVPYKMCIPYEGNEHLLGTRDIPEKEYVIVDENAEVETEEETSGMMNEETVNDREAVLQGTGLE